jgi:formylglycine-generating enzyme required for sulfatase activity
MIRPTRLLAAAAALSTLVAGCALHRGAAPVAAPEPGMMVVPKGEFTMGRDEGRINEQPAHDVRVKEYYIDRTEVSAADFAAFLNAEGNPGEKYFTADEYATVVQLPEAGGRSRYEPRSGLAELPANNVSWYGADAYCRWRGRRLPTEAEWEKAARGVDERVYPWGEPQPTAERSRFDRSWDELRQRVMVPVQALPGGASVYGLLNLSGNVMEWVSDWYRQNLCDFCHPQGEVNLELVHELVGDELDVKTPAPAAGEPGAGGAPPAPPPKQRQAPPRDNPTGPSAGAFKVLRGGSWRERDPAELTASHRFWLDPAQRFPHTGFRCALDPRRADDAPALDKKP